MRKFLASNETKYRLLRTILQGIIGVIVAYIDVIVGVMSIPDEFRPMIVALVMAVLSPIMSELGAKTDTDEMTDEDALLAIEESEYLQDALADYDEESEVEEDD